MRIFAGYGLQPEPGALGDRRPVFRGQRVEHNDVFVRFAGDAGKKPVPETLRLNDKGRFITPSHMQYHHQWLWDAGFHAIILAQYDTDLAKREINTLLEGQWDNGFIAHIQFNPDVTAVYRPNAEDWATGQATSGITQPPLIATAVREVFEKTGDRAWLAQVYPAVLKYHEWMKAERDPENTGLVSILHAWESGMDNSPIFDGLREKLLKERYGDVEVPVRVDTQNINQDERPKDDDYKVYWGLIRDFQDVGWNQKKMVEISPFRVADPLFNTIWVKNNEDLAALAEALGRKKDALRLRGWANQTRKAVRRELWSRKDNFFYAKDQVSGDRIPVKTISGLLPLYAAIPTKNMARRLLAHIKNPEEFGGGAGIPSTAFNEPSFDEKRYWRGPVWVNIHWFLIQGLRNYGFNEEAGDLTARTKRLTKNAGFQEYYHPFTGAGLGAKDFSWSNLSEIL